MPPKKPDAAAPALPPPAPVISPLVVAAQKVVEKWTSRLEDSAKRIAETDRNIAALAEQKAVREARLKTLLAEVSVITVPKPPEPEPAVKAAKPVKGKAAETPPPPPPLDEEDIKRQQKLQAAVMAIYKKKRERPLARDTPPPTADSSKKNGTLTNGSAAALAEDADAEESASQHGTAAAASAVASPATHGLPAVSDEPGIVKPADLDVELWAQVLRMRDERIDTEEALTTVLLSAETAEARRRNLANLDQVVKYSYDAAKFELERAKEMKIPLEPTPPPQTPGSPSARRASQIRPPSQLLRR
jgi:hypothetical protein